MADVYSDDEGASSRKRGRKGGDEDDYYGGARRTKSVPTPEDAALRRAGGEEALDRDDVRALLGSCTGQHPRALGLPDPCKPYGSTFGSLAGVLSAVKSPFVVVETVRSGRVAGEVRSVGRDLSVGLDTAPPPEAPSASLPFRPLTLVRGRDVVAIHLDAHVYVATALAGYVRDAQLSGAVRKGRKQAGKGGARAVAAMHAPVGLRRG